jgi:hypothetical protein
MSAEHDSGCSLESDLYCLYLMRDETHLERSGLENRR